jgi:hypothetical protein
VFADGLAIVRDHRRLARCTYLAGMLGIGLLVLPASLSEVNGAKLRLRLGPFSLQPGQFSKVLIIARLQQVTSNAGRRVFCRPLNWDHSRHFPIPGRECRRFSAVPDWRHVERPRSFGSAVPEASPRPGEHRVLLDPQRPFDRIG